MQLWPRVWCLVFLTHRVESQRVSGAEIGAKNRPEAEPLRKHGHRGGL